MPRSLRTAAIVAVTGAALFMVVLDNLIVASSLPALQSSLNASLDTVEWVIDAYILTIGVTLLTGAALGDRYGRKRVFVFGLVLFTASSAAAALAPNIGFLVGARVVQGLGSAMVLPLTLTLVSAAFPPERRGLALGMWTSIAGCRCGVGADRRRTAGQCRVVAPDLLGQRADRDRRRARRVACAARRTAASTSRLDPVGMALVAGGLFAVIEATVRAPTPAGPLPPTVVGYVVGVVMLAAFVAHERRAPHAMIPGATVR